MFITFVNDLIAALEQHDVKTKLFASDLKLQLRVTDACDLLRLQPIVSASKCCMLSVGKKTVLNNTAANLIIGDNTLSLVNSCVDLGSTISNDLLPHLHINIIVAKAHKWANAICCFVSRCG